MSRGDLGSLVLATVLALVSAGLPACHKMSDRGAGGADDDGAGDADSDVDVDSDSDSDGDGPPPANHLPPVIAAGGFHSCAVDALGGAACWGSNMYGQLGNGNSGPGEMELAPVEVVGIDGPVRALAGGYDFTCAVVGDGAAKCWGRSEYGELGYGSYQDSPVPVDVVGLDSGVAAIAAGHDHACAVTTAGAIKCWGSNGDGRLGNGESGYPDPNYYYTPQDVYGIDSGAASISCAFHHTCAVMEDRTVRCWGRDLPEYVLTEDDLAFDVVPVEMPELGDDNLAVVTGTMHTCVLKATGAVECLGFNAKGQLGDGTTGDSTAPVEVIGIAPPAIGLVAGGYANCALLEGGAVKCWGNGVCLGVGSTYDYPEFSSTPLVVHGLGLGVATISSEFEHVCAELETGSVWCWGAAGAGQTGNGTSDEEVQWWPAEVEGL